MRQWLSARLLQLDQRLLLGGMAAMLVFIVLQAWLLLFRQPLVQYAQMRVDPRIVAQAERDALALPREAERLTSAIGELRGRLAPTHRTASNEQMVVQLIGDLDRLAQRHGVSLNGVRPSAPRKVPSFDEATFEVAARGGYPALMRWLAELEAQSPSLAIAQFEISPATGAERVISVRIAAYRSLELPEDKE